MRSNHYLRLLLFFILVSFIMIFACAGPPKVKAELPISAYYMLNDSLSWERISTSIRLPSVMIVEKKDDNYGVLKEKYRKNAVSIDEMDYSGFMFYYDNYTSSMTINAYQFLDQKSDNLIAQKITKIKNDITKLSGDFKGEILVIDSDKKLTDEQVQLLVNLPVNCLIFENLDYISNEQAKTLATFKGENLCLSGLLWIGNDHAKALAEFQGEYLQLNGIRAISKSQVKALCEFKGKQIFLENLNDESRIIIEKLAVLPEAELVLQ